MKQESSFFEKINKTNKSIERLTKKERRQESLILVIKQAAAKKNCRYQKTNKGILWTTSYAHIWQHRWKGSIPQRAQTKEKSTNYYNSSSMK